MLRLVSVVLRLVSIMLCYFFCVAACFCCVTTCFHCFETCFHRVAACFRCVVLILLCCSMFPLCCVLFPLRCSLFLLGHSRGLQARRDPTGPDTLSPFGPGLGHFFFFYRSGLGRTRAHLASLLYLCPYRPTRRAHMATVWNTDYIINITHRLSNAKITQYFEMFPMQVIALACPCPVKHASGSTLHTNDWICISAHLSRLSV